LVWAITFKRHELIELCSLEKYARDSSDDGKLTALQIALHLLCLSHDVTHEPEELAVALLHPLLVGLGRLLGSALDLEHTMLRGSRVIGDLHGA